MRTLAPFYRGWDRYQRLLDELLEPLTAEHLTGRAAPHLWAAWRIAAHIAAARVFWFHVVMGEGEVGIAPLRRLDERADTDAPNAPELRSALDLGWRLISQRLERWTAADLAARFTLDDGATVSRQWIIWHVLEHDLHHGGELFLTVGGQGQSTPAV